MMDLHELPNIREYVPLADKTTFGVGGKARYYAEPTDAESLMQLMGEAKERATRVFMLGGGSNVLISDSGVDGLVLRPRCLDKKNKISFDAETGRVTACAWVPLATLLSEAAKAGWAGLDDFAGIPGTVGGAIMGNAGLSDVAIGDRVTVLRGVNAAGLFVEIEGREVKFGYRTSGLFGVALTEVELALSAGDPAFLQKSMRDRIIRKRTSQPLGEKSAGCIFKNPPGESAGKLIDKLGLKGCSVGDANVSTVHANFIVNAGAATSRDILCLIDKVRETVLKETGVELRVEVETWP